MTAPRLGAVPRTDGSCDFLVWAPSARAVDVEIVAPSPRTVRLQRLERGYHAATVDSLAPGARYLLRLDGAAGVPDPASRAQPDGVHGPSEIVDVTFPWSADAWAGLREEELVLYELHVGTFSEEATFEAVIPRLQALRALGVTAIELMPVASFPGARNWGYDGVLPFAVQNSYGGVRGLQALVDACHGHDLGVFVDVVYNHLGPEGNRLAGFGPYFTGAYRTPWGDALNFDGPHSDEVRRFFVEHALFLVEDCRVDGLRLDATHAIHDRSARTFLEELAATVQRRAAALGRSALVIAESDQNDPRYVWPREGGGLGMDGVWCDDLHHALHVALTGEGDGYYADFGALELLADAWASGMAFQGRWSRFRQRRHGRPVESTPPWRFVVCAQNHDQVGNRMLGERVASLVPPEALPLAAAVVLLSPCTPLLFMGEEHGERRPFLYFTSHGDPALADAVRKGRREEFATFAWKGEAPDPQDEATFRASVLGPPDAAGLRLRETYGELLALRRTLPGGTARARVVADRVVHATRGEGAEAVHVLYHFGDAPATVAVDAPAAGLRRIWDSRPEVTKVPDHVGPDAARALRLMPWQAVVLRS